MSAVQGLGFGLTILLTGTSKNSPNSLKPMCAARSFQNRALHLLLKKKPPVFDPQSVMRATDQSWVGRDPKP